MSRKEESNIIMFFVVIGILLIGLSFWKGSLPLSNYTAVKMMNHLTSEERAQSREEWVSQEVVEKGKSEFTARQEDRTMEIIFVLLTLAVTASAPPILCGVIYFKWVMPLIFALTTK